MIIAKKEDDSKLVAIVHSIKRSMNEWQLMNVVMLENSNLSQDEVIQHLYQKYKEYEGILYPVSKAKIVVIIRLGLIDNYIQIKSDLEKQIPKHACRITIKKMSAIGIKQIQIELTEKQVQSATLDLYEQRKNRKKNIIMVVDDDSFIRKSMKFLLSSCGDVISIADSKDVLTSYIEHNPDIVFLDIHINGHSGLTLVPELMKIDSDSCIVMLSADSVKENVLSSLTNGAIGFLTKPPSKEKVKEYINQCITIK